MKIVYLNFLHENLLYIWDKQIILTYYILYYINGDNFLTPKKHEVYEFVQHCGYHNAIFMQIFCNIYFENFFENFFLI